MSKLSIQISGDAVDGDGSTACTWNGAISGDTHGEVVAINSATPAVGATVVVDWEPEGADVVTIRSSKKIAEFSPFCDSIGDGTGSGLLEGTAVADMTIDFSYDGEPYNHTAAAKATVRVER